MAGSTTPKIGAGTLFQVGDGASPEVFTTVPGVFDIIPIGNEAKFVEVTTIDSTTMQHIVDMNEAPEKEIVLNDLPGNSTQQTFLGYVAAKSQHNCKLVFPNGRTAAFALLFGGYKIDKAEKHGQIKIIVSAIQQGNASWTIA